MSLNYTGREYEFDYAHRVLHHISKCNNFHGHRGKIILSFSYDVSTIGDHIGYPIDFSEIKRVVYSWFDEYWDHGYLANEKDIEIISLIKNMNRKLHICSLGNPSAENIAKEIFYIADYFLKDRGLNISSVIFYETPNCHVECKGLKDEELSLLINNSILNNNLKAWKEKVGKMEYDCRLNEGDIE